MLFDLFIAMKNSWLSKLSFAIAALLAAWPVWAHHGSSGFDQKKPVHLVGKVSGLEWMNPHIVIHLDVPGPGGKATTWLVNTLPPNAAKRQGFSKDSFAIGAQLTIDGYQATDGSNHVNAASIAFPGGAKIITPGCFNAEGTGLGWEAVHQNQCYQPAPPSRP